MIYLDLWQLDFYYRRQNFKAVGYYHNLGTAISSVQRPE